MKVMPPAVYLQQCYGEHWYLCVQTFHQWQASKGRTTVIVAHRLTTIRNADVIVAMREGVAVEAGSHDELMRSQGLYHSLVTTQVQKQTQNGELIFFA